MKSTRELAAIMFSDLEGFSALANQNEAKALQLIEINRQHQKPIINKYGEFVKEMGDGMLAKFKSAADSIACAHEIQETVPSILKGKIRIGIHVGEVTEENGDVFGDGVNIASRIESVAEAGSIYISEAVYSAIKSREDIKCEFVGEKEFKNIAEAVKCYKVTSLDPSLLKSDKKFSQSSTTKYVVAAITILVVLLLLWRFYSRTEKDLTPTIAVLPMIMVQGDTSDQYLSAGLTEELVRSLGKVQSLTVINPISTLRYMASLQPFADASRDLPEADFLVSGSYKKAEGTVEMQVNLIGKNSEELWSNNFSRDMAMLPQMIGQIATEISGAVKIELSEDEKYRINEIKAVDPDNYALWLKGMSHIGRYRPPEMMKGLLYLQEAVDNNPADARAWAGLAEGLVYLGHSPAPPPGVWQKAKAAAIRAIQLDSTMAEAWASLAHTKTYFEWDYEGAEFGYNKANELNPSLAMNHYHYAWHLALFERYDEAISEHKKAQELDPFMPMHTAWLGWMYTYVGMYEEGLEEVRKSMEIVPELPLGYFVKGHIYTEMGEYDSAFAALEQARKGPPLFKHGLGLSYLKAGRLEEGLEALKELKNEPLNSMNALMLARFYEQIDSLDQFFEYANYEPAHAFTPWLRVSTKNPLILNDPRFEQLMEKMNLQMPNEN